MLETEAIGFLHNDDNLRNMITNNAMCSHINCRSCQCKIVLLRHDFLFAFKRNSAFEIGKIRYFVVSSVFSDLPKTGFFSCPFRSFLNLETATFCYNECFDWSNISYHPMTSFVTVLTTIVSGFISTCRNVFSCSCRP